MGPTATRDKVDFTIFAAHFIPMISAAIPFPDIGTELFRLEIGGFTLALRYYALAYIIGIIIGWRIILAAIRRAQLWPDDRSPMSAEQLENLLTWIVVGVILGGRLGFVTFYQPAYYLQNPVDILKVWQGGMSFHGGFLGVVVAVALFARHHKLTLPATSDAIALGAPPGLLLGRLANFTNAELWGRPTDAPWGVIFPGEAAQFCPQITGLCARHPSQLYEAALEGLILGAAMYVLAFRFGWLKRAWAMTGLFLAGYGLSRFLVEFVRQPDAQFTSPNNPVGYALQIGGAGMTMGQLLSVPMVALGLWLITRSKRT